MIKFPILFDGTVQWLTVDIKASKWLQKWFINTPMVIKGVSK